MEEPEVCPLLNERLRLLTRWNVNTVRGGRSLPDTPVTPRLNINIVLAVWFLSRGESPQLSWQLEVFQGPAWSY